MSSLSETRIQTNGERRTVEPEPAPDKLPFGERERRAFLAIRTCKEALTDLEGKTTEAQEALNVAVQDLLLISGAKDLLKSAEAAAVEARPVAPEPVEEAEDDDEQDDDEGPMENPPLRAPAMRLNMIRAAVATFLDTRNRAQRIALENWQDEPPDNLTKEQRQARSRDSQESLVLLFEAQDAMHDTGRHLARLVLMATGQIDEASASRRIRPDWTPCGFEVDGKLVWLQPAISDDGEILRGDPGEPNLTVVDLGQVVALDEAGEPLGRLHVVDEAEADRAIEEPDEDEEEDEDGDEEEEQARTATAIEPQAETTPADPERWTDAEMRSSRPASRRHRPYRIIEGEELCSLSSKRDETLDDVIKEELGDYDRGLAAAAKRHEGGALRYAQETPDKGVWLLDRNGVDRLMAVIRPTPSGAAEVIKLDDRPEL